MAGSGKSGETHDQIVVQIPRYRTVCCADNFYPLKIESLTALSRASVNMPTVNHYQTFAALERQKLG
ncbi:MAG: hypothetical protein HY892_10585 [Deltaproteobacteria bacterium]|nr:hypothetical protein [Deltaproteobacteria bacterium]